MKYILFVFLSVCLCSKIDKEVFVTCEFIHNFCGYTNENFIIKPDQGIVTCSVDKCTLSQQIQLDYEVKISFWTRKSSDAASERLELKLNQQTIWSSDTDLSIKSPEWHLIERQLPPLKFNVNI
jgi:hypothetical protein